MAWFGVELVKEGEVGVAVGGKRRKSFFFLRKEKG